MVIIATFPLYLSGCLAHQMKHANAQEKVLPFLVSWLHEFCSLRCGIMQKAGRTWTWNWNSFDVPISRDDRFRSLLFYSCITIYIYYLANERLLSSSGANVGVVFFCWKCYGQGQKFNCGLSSAFKEVFVFWTRPFDDHTLGI